MSQHDMDVADGPGATVRADINAALQALASNSKGPSAPATPYAGQFWLEDDNPSSTVWTLWQYDGTDWIKVGEIDSTNNRFNPITSQSADVTSASTINLDAAYGTITDVTGTTTITAVTPAQGKFRLVRFTGALTLTNGASLVLPTGANFVTTAGDYAIFAGYASSVVRCVGFFRADGTPVGDAQHKVGSFTRDISTASGTQSVTGVGFKPKFVRFTATVNGQTFACWGSSDGSSHLAMYANDGTAADNFGTTSNAIYLLPSSGNLASATITFTADGFDVVWTKTGSPTGTARIIYEAHR